LYSIAARGEPSAAGSRAISRPTPLWIALGVVAVQRLQLARRRADGQAVARPDPLAAAVAQGNDRRLAAQDVAGLVVGGPTTGVGQGHRVAAAQGNAPQPALGDGLELGQRRRVGARSDFPQGEAVAGQAARVVDPGGVGRRADQPAVRRGVDEQVGDDPLAVDQDHGRDPAVAVDTVSPISPARAVTTARRRPQRRDIAGRVQVQAVGQGRQHRPGILAGRREPAQSPGHGGQAVVLVTPGLAAFAGPQPVVVEGHAVEIGAGVAEALDVVPVLLGAVQPL
jgi:hypothetical protein